MAASPPGSGDTIEPWLSEASRAAVSSFSAGTFGRDGGQQQRLGQPVVGAEAAAATCSGSSRSVRSVRPWIAEQQRPQLVPVERVGRAEQRGRLGVQRLPAA